MTDEERLKGIENKTFVGQQNNPGCIDLIDINWLIQQAERVQELKEQNSWYRVAWMKAKQEVEEHGAGKADEDITDDGKEAAYRQGAEDMYDDFIDEFKRALEGEAE